MGEAWSIVFPLTHDHGPGPPRENKSAPPLRADAPQTKTGPGPRHQIHARNLRGRFTGKGSVHFGKRRGLSPGPFEGGCEVFAPQALVMIFPPSTEFLCL